MGYSLEKARVRKGTDLALASSSSAQPVTDGRLVRPRHTYVPWVVAIAIVGVWWLVSDLHLFTTLALPSPGRVAHDVAYFASNGFNGRSFAANIGASILRIAVGFIGAVIVGIPIGFAMASSEVVFNAIDPVLQFLRPIPPLAYIPVMVLWFGSGQLSKFVLIFFCTIPIMIISTMSGVKNVQETRLRVAQVFGANKWQLFRYVVLPSALPEIFTGMRVGIGVAWTCLVAAEMIAAQSGLGALILIAGHELRTGMVFVGIVFIGIIGYLMELTIRTTEQQLVPWKGKA